MSWTEIEVPDQKGRTAVVTGGNGGLGLENVRVLAGKGARVVMAARNQEKATAAKESVLSVYPNASVEIRALDLASLDSIGEFATSIRHDHESLDLLINNAGVMAIPQRRTDDGFEMQFGVNHLGHHALTGLLLPLLVRTPGSRVISVTSTARHFGSPIDPADPHLERDYTPWAAYARSKLANVHFALGLEQRLRSAGAETISLVAHPGLSHTDLQANSARESERASERLAEPLAHRFGMSARRGALSQLRAAVDPGASGGELYAPRFVNSGSPVRRPLFGRSHNQSAIDTLFEVSRAETGVDVDPRSHMSEAQT